ncbi:alpha/beta hydrolase [Streptomyces sp. MB09-02B]|uniref:alpha/beta hydrolase n=1 Tax=Streptomyces sp. MB09-02B TaxID=3028667 RepID=UPI0029ACE607|nr:alpha/beta fold hydrolase [Streptomyces sp. MB09-02B]MDX3640005.1 alpha/beta fold hydrolase [Streptomyces sp. MB09-02B]
MGTQLSQFFLAPRPLTEGTHEATTCVVQHRTDPAAPTVVLLSGLGVGMSEPRYLWAVLARELAGQGLNVLQYDHPGQGDSSLTGRLATPDSVRTAAYSAVAQARRIGSGRVVTVGYGLGNLLVAELLRSGETEAGVLVCPGTDRCRAGAHQPEAMTALARRGRVAPDELQDDDTVAALLDAMVGEPYQPPQPAGPVDAALLAAAAVAAEEAFTGLRDARALVVAADREDRDYARRTGLAVREIRHEPTKWAPSWHWSYEPRRAVLDAVLGFVREMLADPAPRELPKSGPSPAVTETVPGPRGDRISSLNFTSGGEHLLGILHEPGPRPGGAPQPVCLIYEPGNPGQRVDIHECGPALAHAGAAHGVPVFRYDSRGMGVSDGSFTHSTWSRRLEDLTAAVARLRSAGVAERFVVVGNSAGARLAAMAAHALPEVTGAVLWGPILSEDGEGPTPRLRRVDGTLAAEWCGLWQGVAYNRDDRGRDYPRLLHDSAVPVLVVYGYDETGEDHVRTMLAETARHPMWELSVVHGSHGFSSRGLAEAVRTTTGWAAALGERSLPEASLGGSAHDR